MPQMFEAGTGLFEDSKLKYGKETIVPPSLLPLLTPPRAHHASPLAGGTKVPGFVHSPLLPAEVRGTESRALFHITDWLPTIAGLARFHLNATSALPLDGLDIWSALSTGSSGKRQEMLYNVNPFCEEGQAGPPKAALRVGDWKLLSYCYTVKGKAGETATGPAVPKGGLPKGWEGGSSPVVLYDLSTDPSETTDVAKANPAVVLRLLRRLATMADEMVEPMQWTPPYQGKDYSCADCPLYNGTRGPGAAWLPWL